MKTLLVKANNMKKRGRWGAKVNGNIITFAKWIKVDGVWYVYSEKENKVELGWEGCEYATYDFDKQAIVTEEEVVVEYDFEKVQGISEKQIAFAVVLIKKQINTVKDHMEIKTLQSQVNEFIATKSAGEIIDVLKNRF